MKRILAFLLMVCSLTLTAAADIAYEPPVTDFYATVQDQVERIEKYHLANSPEGYVTMLNKPDGTPINHYTNGTNLMVYGTYSVDGVLWAYIPIVQSGELESPGWILLDQLSRLYIHSDFMAEHDPYKTDLSTFEWPAETEYVYIFRYPGSAEIVRKYELGGNDHKEMGRSLSFHWKDEQGRYWAYIGYYMGRQNGFICLDDPQNPTPFAELTANKLVEGQTLYPAKEPPHESEAIPKGNLKPLAGGLVAAAVGIAIGLLAAIFYGKKKEDRR